MFVSITFSLPASLWQLRPAGGYSVQQPLTTHRYLCLSWRAEEEFRIEHMLSIYKTLSAILSKQWLLMKIK